MSVPCLSIVIQAFLLKCECRTSGIPCARTFDAAARPVTPRESCVPGLRPRHIHRLQYKTGSTSRGAHTQKNIEQRTLARECLHPRLLVRCRELFKVTGIHLQWTYEVRTAYSGVSIGGCFLNLGQEQQKMLDFSPRNAQPHRRTVDG